MKKYLSFIFILLVFIFVDCKDENRAVKEFSLRLGEILESNDVGAILDVYPTADTTQIPMLSFDKDRIKIFPESDGTYKINYGNGAYAIVRHGYDDAFEVIESRGIYGPDTHGVMIEESTDLIGENSKEKSSNSQESVKDFVARFKKNIKAGKWTDAGWKGDSGDCFIYLSNLNSFPVEGKDYYITFKFEYQFEGGADMYSENCKKNGKDIPAGGKAKFTHFYTDDCGPEKVKIHFTLTDQQIYEKYKR